MINKKEEEDTYVMTAFRQWQHDGMHRSKGVFVSHFEFYPQSEGFYLQATLSILDKHDAEWPDTPEDFYGTPIECVHQVEKRIEEEKKRIIDEVSQ
jgi:hypothetical protein